MTKSGDYCRNYARVAWSTPHPATKVRMFARLRCKSWDCDYCSRVNARMWQAHLLDNINRLSTETTRWSFLTITSRGSIRDPHGSYHSVNNCWRKLTNLWREYHRWFGGLNLIYARVLEAHEDSAVHAHAIVGHDLPLQGFVNINHAKKYKKFKKNFFDKPRFRARMTWRGGDLAFTYGGGFMFDCQRVNAPNAGLVVSYITKYMTKHTQGELDLPKYAKRIVTSQNFTEFGKMESDEALVWETDTDMKWDKYLELERGCDAIHDLNKGKNIKLDDFDVSGYYPPLDERFGNSE